FIEEDDAEPCVYGTRSPLRSWNPLWANFEVYAALAKDSWHAASWGDKLRVWFKPPGWRPADVAARFPKPAFRIERQRFDPAMGRGAQWFALAMFLGLLGATSAFLWDAHLMSTRQQATWALGILAGLWLVGVVCEGRARRAVPASLNA